ncbi:MAG: hypothetical protein WCF93_03395 [Candidatus Moraniibacteriota bacterium]
MTNLPEKEIEKQENVSSKKVARKKYILGLMIVIALSFAVYENRKAAYAAMDNLKLIPRPECFTELYFNDHINLPKQLSPGEKISFSFVIHNLEGASKDYPYVVYFKSKDGQFKNIEEKTVTLADGEVRAIDESYVSESLENQGGIYIKLKDQQQEIHFLLNNN